jgi:uracil-DNA glycosylase family 4
MAPTGEGRRGILVLAESPGRTEDEQGVQLIGEAGQLLRQILRDYDIDLDRDCRKTNALSCRPEGNRTPTSREIDACRTRVWEEICAFQPRLILLLGNAAVESFLGHRWKKDLGGINKWRGFPIPDRETKCWVVATYHPSFLLRSKGNPAVERVFREDIELAIGYADRPFPEMGGEEERIEVIQDAGRAVERLKGLYQTVTQAKEGLIAFDYETTGLKPYNKGHRIVCCGVAYDSTGGSGPFVHDQAFVFEMAEDSTLRLWWRRILTSARIRKTAHNCLHARSFVLMADGTKRMISQLVNSKSQALVKSFNVGVGKIEHKQIVNWYRQIDPDVRWMKIITEQSINGHRGSQSHALTNDHEVYLKNKGMTRVDSVRIGDEILLAKPGLSFIQEQMIRGSLLGDASLVLQRGSKAKNPHFQVGHCEKQKEYLEWKHLILENVSSRITARRWDKGFSNPNSLFYTFRTKSLSDLSSVYDELYVGGKKRVSKAYLSKLTPLSLAVWYMDDGSICRHRTSSTVLLHTYGLSEAEINDVINHFKSVYNICWKKRRHSSCDGWSLCVGKKAGGARFIRMIAGYVHPAMRYKIPSSWCEEVSSFDDGIIKSADIYKDHLYSKVIDVIPTKMKISKNLRYCIEVEDNHNFFTTLGLVKNCKFEDTWTNVILGHPVKGWQWCSMQAAHVLDNRPDITGLKFQAYANFGIADYASEIVPFLQSDGSSDNAANQIDRAPLRDLMQYCGMDALLQLRLARKQMGQIR